MRILLSMFLGMFLLGMFLPGMTPWAAAAENPTEDVDLLALDLKMARFLVKHVDAKLEPETQVHALMGAVFSKKGLGITYEDSGTRTAIETFEAGSGNCLSFTILLVAMARHLGLNASFMEVGVVMSWDRRGDVVLRNHHMFVEIEIENGRMKVDFLPGEEKRYRLVRRVKENRVRAHFFNNLGVDALASGDAEGALVYFDQAVAVDDSFAHAWTNRGVAFRYLDDFGRAEQSHRKALELAPDELTAVTNLASLYMAVGRQGEAGPLLEQAEGHLQRNPFHHFSLGSKALSSGDAKAAIGHFRDAIRRLPDEPEFHAAMAGALVKMGEVDKARQSLERALDLADEDGLRDRLRSELVALSGLTAD